MRRFGVFLCFVLLTVFNGYALEPVGIFEDHVDIGNPSIPGIAELVGGIYKVDGVGRTIDDFADQCHFAYKRMSGSFAIEANPWPLDNVGRGGLMIRQDLDPDSVHISFLMTSAAASDSNSDLGSVFPTFRTLKGGGTKRDGDPTPVPGGFDANHTGPIRFERIGNSVHFYTKNTAGAWVYIQTEVAPLIDPIYVGLGATAESANNFGVFEFTDVVIEEFPLTVDRSLASENFEPGMSINPVTLTASARQDQTVNAVVNEIAPVGAVISNIQASAGQAVDNGDGTITWTLNNFSGNATLTYNVKLGRALSACWRGTFSDGIHRNSYIGGVAVLPINPTFLPPENPIPIDLLFPTVIQAEQANPLDPVNWGLMMDPRRDSGIVVVSMGTGAGQMLEYAIDIPVAGTYYFFWATRGEDGNSDSFHTNIDVPPAGNDTTRSNMGSSKAYDIRWVRDSSPGRNPRPFDLPAGVSYFIVGNREDSASIDWIAVTNNPNLAIANFNPNVSAQLSRTIDVQILRPGSLKTSVTITAAIRTGITDNSIITETPPTGFAVTNLRASDGSPTLNADGSISLNVTGVTGKQITLQYDVAAPAGSAGSYPFSGNLVLDSDTPLAAAGANAVYVLGASQTPLGKTMYVFRNIAANTFPDQVILAYLESVMGLHVVQFDDTNAAGYEMPADLSGCDATYVSESVGSGNFANRLYHETTEKPIVIGEILAADDILYQPNVGTGGADGIALDIVDNQHPITQGFPLGVVQVWPNSLQMGYLDNPPAGVHVLATEPGNPNRALLWVVEKGATVNGQLVPGMRIGAWIQLNGFSALNADGLRLMNQVFSYALGVAPVAVDEFMLY
ncbi:MAG: hypothetical protein C4527_05265 [Candidatus Omnitrophota bacterium]|jgi:hypothetical protein|nr:MAG: hypothetical protein C4527_05265 [Candidatus Omnitrophota bacterium]